MTFVIPMAGRGERFTKAGFVKPKMLIEVHGKTLLEWSIDSLPLSLCTNLVFICLKEHEQNFQISKFISDKYGQYENIIKFVYLDEVTRGQAETVLKGREYFFIDDDLLIFNIDTYFYSPTLKQDLLRDDVDGILGAFHSSEDRFSFARVDKDGIVVETAEKKVISNNALTGLYHFKKASDFIKIAEKHIDSDIRTKGEFYIAPMYNELIQEGKKYIINMVEDHWILGTPDELNLFKKQSLEKND